MYFDLMKLEQPMDMEKYSLKDLALYFEKYNGYVCEITTEKNKIKFLLDISCFSHLIGIQHAFKGQKSKNKYAGVSGFEMIKNGEITYSDVRKAAKNSKDSTPWANIKDRIKYLPMFLNTIRKNTYIKARDDNAFCRIVHLKGDWFLYKNLYSNIYPIMSLKKIVNDRIVVETFIVEKDLRLLGALPSEKVISIKLISPLENTSPITVVKDSESMPV